MLERPCSILLAFAATGAAGAGMAGSFNPGPSWQIRGTGDFNGDGRSDILWQGSDGTRGRLAFEKGGARPCEVAIAMASDA